MRDATRNDRAKTVVISDAKILTATGKKIEKGTLIMRGGEISSVVEGAFDRKSLPAGAVLIEANGRTITPGLIDTHSHIGVYAQPSDQAHADGNEAVAPVTAYARAEYGYWPQDPAITRARAGGVTTALVLPGSANLIGGRGATVVMKPGRHFSDVAFPGAPPSLKMACGENPKRVYGSKGGPQTRMAEYAQFRSTYQKAKEHRAQKDAYARKLAMWEEKRASGDKKAKDTPRPLPPAENQGLDTLGRVLDGDVMVQVHCYRSDDMTEMVRVARDAGFRIRSFHHALDAYKIRDTLTKEGIAISTWADWWGFKLEAYDGIPENAALFHEAGGRAVIHSDSAEGIQRLNQEAGKALAAGRAAGIKISDDEALMWITKHPAWVLGIDSVTGTLEVGKRADVVLWSGDPFSVYSLPDVVWQAGEITHRRDQPLPRTDFEMGTEVIR